MEMCTEDEDSWIDQNFKCPYGSQEVISQDNLIKHMGNDNLMGFFYLQLFTPKYNNKLYVLSLVLVENKKNLRMVYLLIINISDEANAYNRSCRYLTGPV